MVDADLEEYKRLEGVLASAEKLQTASPHGVNPVFSSMVDNIRRQLETLEHKIKEKEQETRQQQELAVQRAVERETGLNASEKEAYGVFLKEDFFTKADFGRLEKFYDKSYDKLTDSGKEEMSYRVWEGVRRNEYTFGELPENLQEKESKKLYLQLTGKQEPALSLQNIPDQDKADFVREYDTGNQKAVSKVLERETFSKNVSTQPPQSVSDKDALAQENKPAQPERSSSATQKSVVAASEISVSGLTEIDYGEVVPPAVAVSENVQTKGRG